MSSKKVLIINIQNHNYAGGIETYTRKLIPILKECGYEIFEYSTCQNIQSKVCEPFACVNQINVARKILLQTEDVINTIPWNQRFKAIINDAKALIYQRKQLQAIAKDYDLIIDNSTIINSLSDAYHKKIIWIQHNDLRFFKKVGQPFRWLMKKIFKLHFPYLEIKRKVVYSAASTDLYKQIFSKKYFDAAHFFDVFLSAPIHNYDEIDLDKKRNGPILFMGRLKDVGQKRTDIADKIAKHLNRPVFAYGSYDDNLDKKFKHLAFKGRYSADKDLPKIFANASLTLITSAYEGASFLAIESITHSTPVAIRNTFAEVNYLLKNQNGLVLDQKATPKAMAQQIENFLNDKTRYEQAVANTQASQGLYNNQIFINKWKTIIAQIEAEQI